MFALVAWEDYGVLGAILVVLVTAIWKFSSYLIRRLLNEETGIITLTAKKHVEFLQELTKQIAEQTTLLKDIREDRIGLMEMTKQILAKISADQTNQSEKTHRAIEILLHAMEKIAAAQEGEANLSKEKEAIELLLSED